MSQWIQSKSSKNQKPPSQKCGGLVFKYGKINKYNK